MVCNLLECVRCVNWNKNFLLIEKMMGDIVENFSLFFSFVKINIVYMYMCMLFMLR